MQEKKKLTESRASGFTSGLSQLHYWVDKFSLTSGLPFVHPDIPESICSIFWPVLQSTSEEQYASLIQDLDYIL